MFRFFFPLSGRVLWASVSFRENNMLMVGWGKLDLGMGVGVSDFHSGRLVGGNLIPILILGECPNPPKPNHYSPLIFKSHSNSHSDSGYQPNAWGDMTMLILIPIHSGSDSSHEPNTPIEWVDGWCSLMWYICEVDMIFKKWDVRWEIYWRCIWFMHM